MPFLGILCGIIWTHGRFNALRPADWAAAVITLLAVPLLSASIAVALVQIRSPRRWLVRHGPGRKRVIFLSLLAGSLAILSTGISLYYANRPWPGTDIANFDPDTDMRRIPDAAVVAANALAFAALATWLMPRRQPGLCAGCGYDVRFSLESSRCPECGRSLMA